MKEFFLVLLFPGFAKRLNEMQEQYLMQSRILADAYLVLDKIALSDDAPARELSKMALHFIRDNRLTIKYQFNSITELFDKGEKDNGR